MAEPPSKRVRSTPSKSGDNDAPAVTPYADLRALANILNQPPTRTPLRAASAGPSLTPGTAASQQAHTPRAHNNNSNNNNNSNRNGSNVRPFHVARRAGPPTTPHAIRALQARRDAALAASGGRRNRRRSAVQERETPRDILRALSRRLAPVTQRLVDSPGVPQSAVRPKLEEDDLDAGPEIPRPLPSMPLDDDEDDSFHERPPRPSIPLDDVDTTMHSIEGGRRAMSEDPQPRISLARMRLSDRFGGDDMDALSEYGVGDVDDTTIGPLHFDGDAEDAVDAEMTNRFGEDDTTRELRAMIESRRRSRVSDFGQPAGADLEDEPTFHFRMPGSRDPSLLLPQPDAEGDTNDAEGEDNEDATLEREAADEQDEEGVQNDAEEPADALAGAEEGEDYETESDADHGMEIDQDGQVSELVLRQGSMLRSASPSAKQQKNQAGSRRKSFKVSRYGASYPSLPSSVTKRLATGFARTYGGPMTKLSKETLEAISQASDWFFEQASEDLASYAEHAGRRTIEEADVVALMSRQRQINASTTPFSLAQKYLPRELLQQIRMSRAATRFGRSAGRKRSRSEMETIEEVPEE